MADLTLELVDNEIHLHTGEDTGEAYRAAAAAAQSAIDAETAAGTAATDAAALVAAATAADAATATTGAATATTKAAEAAGYAAGLGAMLPSVRLPSSVKTALRWKKPGSGTVIKDMVGAHDVDLATLFSGGYSWDERGNMVLTAQAGKLTAQNHRAMVHVFQTPEGGSTNYYLAFSSGKAIGKNNGASAANIPDLYGLHGDAVHKVARRNDAAGSGAWEFEGGGIIGICATASATDTGQPIIAAANGALSGKVGQMTCYYTLVLDAVPSTADVAQIRRWLDLMLFSEGYYFAGKTCPVQRRRIAAFGESSDVGTFFATCTGSATAGVFNCTVAPTSGVLAVGQVLLRSGGSTYTIASLGTGTGGTGTYNLEETTAAFALGTCYTNGLAAIEQTTRSHLLFVNAYNNASAATAGKRQKRLSLKKGQYNAIPPDQYAIAPKVGWSIGLRDYLNDLDDDGQAYALLQVSNGSTFRLPGGVGASVTTSTVYSPNAAGGSTTVNASASRNSLTLETAGMIWTLFNRNWHKDEQQARLQGIGYSGTVFVESSGLNDAYIGTVAVTSAALVTGLFTDWRQHIIDFCGIANPQFLFCKPHEPDGNLDGYPDGTLGDGGDYPNTSVGTDRLAALARWRTGIDDFKTAQGASVEVVDDNQFQINRAGGDTVHQSGSGLIAKGKVLGPLIRQLTDVRHVEAIQ